MREIAAADTSKELLFQVVKPKDGEDSSGSGASKEKALLKEFSSLMDKIAASIYSGNVGELPELNTQLNTSSAPKLPIQEPHQSTTEVKLSAADKDKDKSVDSPKASESEVGPNSPIPTDSIEVKDSSVSKTEQATKDTSPADYIAPGSSQLAQESKDSTSERPQESQMAVTAPDELKVEVQAALELGRTAAPVASKPEQISALVDAKPELVTAQPFDPAPVFVQEAADGSTQEQPVKPDLKQSAQDLQTKSAEVTQAGTAPAPLDGQLSTEANTKEIMAEGIATQPTLSPESYPTSQERMLREMVTKIMIANQQSQLTQAALTTPSEQTRDLYLSQLVIKNAIDISTVGSIDTKQVTGARAANSSVQAFDPNSSAFRPFESNARTEAPRTVRPLPKVFESKTMEKVESALKEAAKSRDGKTISLRLDPPNLGSLKVDVTLREQTLHARIVADSSQVAMLLKERSHELQSILRKLGIDVDKVTVSIMNDDFGQLEADSNYGSGNSAGNGTGSQNSDSGAGHRDVFMANVPKSVMIEGSNSLKDHWVA